MNKKIIHMAYGAAIAALYVVLTFAFQAFASGAVQVRVAEMLTIMPVFTSYAIPGLAIGCLLANIFTGCLVPDIIFGTLATVLGAIGTRLLRKKPFLAIIPPVLSNSLIIPFVIKKCYMDTTPLPLLILFIAAGEIISIGVFGTILLVTLRKYSSKIYLSE